MAETDISVSVSAEMSADTDTEADNFRSLLDINKSLNFKWQTEETVSHIVTSH